MIIPYIQQRMQKEFKLKEIQLPQNDKVPAHIRNNIYISEDFYTNTTKCCLLIQGSGAVRAGQWARALCINDSLKTGAIFGYLKKAFDSGFSVIVFNPNLNRAPEDASLENLRPNYDDLWLPGKPKLKEVPHVKIPEHETPEIHTINVWDQFVAKSPAKELVIVAHSAGGSCTMSLLKKRGKKFNLFSRIFHRRRRSQAIKGNCLYR
jgi:hypothetical protein